MKEEYIEKKNEDLSKYYLEVYTWYRERASKKVEKPEFVKYPIWCSLEENRSLPLEGSGNVILELSVEEEEVLVIRGEDWD